MSSDVNSSPMFETSVPVNLKSEYRHKELSKAAQKRETRSTTIDDKKDKGKAKDTEEEAQPITPFSQEVIAKLKSNDIVAKILRGEKKGMFVAELMQIAYMAGAGYEHGNGSHTKMALPEEKLLIFAFRKGAKKYQIEFMRTWLLAHGMPMPE